MQEQIMAADLNDLFEVMEPKGQVSRSDRILAGLFCEAFGESPMEFHTRGLAGKPLRQPCFDRVEEKA
jgi:hypothetical protein